MTFSFFFREKRDDTLALVIDIGSASIGTALIQFNIKKSRLNTKVGPHILATNRETIPFQDTLMPTPFLFAMNRALERSLKNIQTHLEGRSAPAHIYCTLSSPWFISKTRNIQIARQNAFKVDEKMLTVVLNDDIERLKEELMDTLPIRDTVVIEKKITQMKLNGYEIKNPYGKITSQMEITATISLSSDKVIESIEREIGHYFHPKSIHFGSFPLAAYSAVRDIFPEQKNFLFVDITGEATDVSLIENDLIVGTVSFSRGKNFFVRAISAEFKTLHEEASALLGMFLRDALNGKSREAVAAVVRRGYTEWSTRFEKSLVALTKESQTPPAVFFTSDSDVMTLFEGLINKLMPMTDSHEENSPKVQYIDHFIVTPFATFETGMIRDPFLAIEALFAEKLNKQK